jgi:hypothetical protein
MQPNQIAEHALKTRIIFFSGGGGWCVHRNFLFGVTTVFPMCSSHVSNDVLQVPNEFPIAAQFYPIWIAHNAHSLPSHLCSWPKRDLQIETFILREAPKFQFIFLNVSLCVGPIKMAYSNPRKNKQTLRGTTI